MTRGMTDEEKVAVKIGDLLADQRLNLDRIGSYVARTEPSTNYRRGMGRKKWQTQQPLVSRQKF
jgi:hypothetical protein